MLSTSYSEVRKTIRREGDSTRSDLGVEMVDFSIILYNPFDA